MSPGELVTAALWAEIRRVAHLIAELAAANHDLTVRVNRLELLHDITEEPDHAHGHGGTPVRADPPTPHER